MLLFKINYRYKLRTSLTLRQVKKTNIDTKERIKGIIELYKNLQNTAKIIQKRIKRYYDKKKSKGLALKKGDKVQLLYKNFKSRQLSKKLDYINWDHLKLQQRFQKLYINQNYQ